MASHKYLKNMRLNFTFTIFILLSFHAFSQENKNNAVQTKQLISENISIRGIAVDGDLIWYSAENGKFGNVNLKTGEHFKSRVSSDSIQPEYRSIAITSTDVFVASAGIPTLFYKISKSTKIAKLVYRNDDEKSFCDAIAFFDDKTGLVIGDQIDGCLTVWKTIDSGESWQILSCSSLPKALKGEGAFAASNTGLKIYNNHVWIFSGGFVSRVYHSSDFGKSWTVSETPIIQGSSMTGIFGGDFYDELTGYAVGGNYDKPTNNTANKISSDDGGKNWKINSPHSGFGYASCVQYFPKSNGKKLISVGQSGVFISTNKGSTWKKIDDCKDYYTIRFVNKNTAMAAGKNTMVQFDF